MGTGLESKRPGPISANCPVEIGGFRRGCDATVRATHDAEETRESRRFAQLFGNLMQSRFLERDRDGALFFLQRRQRTLRSAEVAPEQEQHGRCPGKGGPEITMKSSVRARGIGVEVRRRMRLRRLAGAIGKMLFGIASAGIQNGQPRWGELSCAMERGRYQMKRGVRRWIVRSANILK